MQFDYGRQPNIENYNQYLQERRALEEEYRSKLMNLQYGQNGNTMPPYGNINAQRDQMQPTNERQQSQQPNAKIAFVQSMEQAKAISISLDGTLYVLVNTSNGELYSKCFDIKTGGDNFKVYREYIIQQTTAPSKANDNVNDDVVEVLRSLHSQIGKMQEELEELKGGNEKLVRSAKVGKDNSGKQPGISTNPTTRTADGE